MLKVKQGVTPKNLVIAAAAINCADGLDFDVVITSGTDGKHMKGSKHYTGEALDLRTSNIPAHQRKKYVDRLNAKLPEYDVIDEGDHIHIEYDPD
jgi:hypothetical protein